MESNLPTFLVANTELQNTLSPPRCHFKSCFCENAHTHVSQWAAALPTCISEQTSQAGGTPCLSTRHKMPSLLLILLPRTSQEISAKVWILKSFNTTILNFIPCQQQQYPKQNERSNYFLSLKTELSHTENADPKQLQHMYSKKKNNRGTESWAAFNNQRALLPLKLFPVKNPGDCYFI